MATVSSKAEMMLLGRSGTSFSQYDVFSYQVAGLSFH